MPPINPVTEHANHDTPSPFTINRLYFTFQDIYVHLFTQLYFLLYLLLTELKVRSD